MKIKRLLAFVISVSMIVGMFPAFVLADESDSEPAGTTVAETTAAKETEPAETKGKKPEEKKPEATKAEEPAETKEEAPEQTKDEAPAETEDKKPAESEDKQPEETKPETTKPAETKPEETKPEETEPEETKPQESTEPDKTEPAETTEPSETKETEPSASESRVPEGKDEPTGKTALPAEGNTVSANKDGECDNDDLFNRFAESKLYKSNTRKALYTSSGSRLTGNNKKIYDKLVPMLKQVADGKATSTEFEITLSDLGLDGVQYTASQLGIGSIVGYYSDGTPYVTETAGKAMYRKLNISIVAINNAILADLPYELYWYDKTVQGAIKLSYPDVTAVEYSLSGWKAYFKGSIMVRLMVAQGYASDEYVVDSNKIGRVNKAVQNAGMVISQAKSMSDYRKLVYYREYIKSAVVYDFGSLGGAVPYGDPWQLVSVFDGDSSTNVVCEGYSKAFKYLCDLTTFDKDISCIIATGDAGGGHMWNIVNMEDGKNYMVDVTNCDSGTIGYPDKLFLVGCTSGSVSSGYVFTTPHAKPRYTYDIYTKSSFDTKDLTLNTKNYLSALVVGGDLGNGVSWQYKAGTLTISGSGAMPDFADYTDTPWYDYVGFIQKIVIAEGVTHVGNSSFDWCQNATGVTLPNSLKSIGEYAFAASGLKSVVIPGSCTSIGTYAFSACSSLTSLTLQNGVKTIGNGAFKGTYISSVTFPASVTDIGEYSFQLISSLTSVTFLGDVKTIGDRAFKNTNLTAVAIPQSVTTLGADSFTDCTKLTTLTIDKDLYNKSGKAAFVNCPLFSITYYDANSAVVNEIAKSGDLAYRITSVADSGYGTVSVAGVINDVESVVIPGTVDIKGGTYKVTKIGVNAFFCNTAIKSVYIGANVLTVGNNAFYGCSNLVKVSGGGRLKTIGTNAFARCTKLSTFVITSKALYMIGQKAFYNDSKLKTIYIKNTTKITKSGVKKSLTGSSVKTVKVKKSKVKKYKKFFTKKNAGRSVKVKK